MLSRPSRSPRLPAPTLLSFAVLAGCASSPLQQPPAESTRTFAVTIPVTDRTLEVHVANGRVTVSHAAVTACEVTAAVRATSLAEAERLANQLQLVPDRANDGVQVLALQAADASAMESVNLCVTLAAPADLAVRVLTRRADVMVHGYRGHLSVDTDSGDVAARLEGGDAEIRSRSGGVRVSGTYARAQVHAEAGAVQVVLPADASAPHVDVQTQTGDITLELPQDSKVAFSARVRNPRNMPCELAATWSEYGTDAGDRWKTYRGTIGLPVEAVLGKSTVNIVSDSGRIALRCLPGS